MRYTPARGKLLCWPPIPSSTAIGTRMSGTDVEQIERASEEGLDIDERCQSEDQKRVIDGQGIDRRKSDRGRRNETAAHQIGVIAGVRS